MMHEFCLACGCPLSNREILVQKCFTCDTDLDLYNDSPGEEEVKLPHSPDTEIPSGWEKSFYEVPPFN